MKKIFEWLKAYWTILVGIALWAAIVVRVFFIGDMSLSNRIQAISMITLVFVTLFYSVQTQKLVKEQRATLEEERKRQNAEFGIQRIQWFLRPLLKRLESLKDCASQIIEARKRPSQIHDDGRGIFRAQMNEIKEFFGENLYMTNASIRYGYLRLTHMTMPTPIENPSEEFITQWKKEIEENIAELEEAVNNEIARIIQNIRKAYEFFLPETKILESSDDLTVLSDRPPKRI